MIARNRFLMVRKHVSVWHLLPAYLREIRGTLEHVCLLAAQGSDSREEKAIVGGTWAGLVCRFGKPRTACAPEWIDSAVLGQRWRLARVARLFERILAPGSSS